MSERMDYTLYKFDPDPDVSCQHGASDGGKSPGHDGVDLGEGQPWQVRLDDEGRCGLAQEYVRRSIQWFTGGRS